MNMYVWKDPYPVSYGASLFVVVAETEDEARKLAFTARYCPYGSPYEKGSKYDRDMAYHAERLGPPTRVLPVPGGEWYEWEE